MIHEKLFADFLKSFRAGETDETDTGIGIHADEAHRLFRQLIEEPATDMTGICYQLAAGQIWEGTGASFRDDAAAAIYRNAAEASGYDPLAELERRS